MWLGHVLQKLAFPMAGWHAISMLWLLCVTTGEYEKTAKNINFIYKMANRHAEIEHAQIIVTVKGLLWCHHFFNTIDNLHGEKKKSYQSMAASLLYTLRLASLLTYSHFLTFSNSLRSHKLFGVINSLI